MMKRDNETAVWLIAIIVIGWLVSQWNVDGASSYDCPEGQRVAIYQTYGGGEMEQCVDE